LRKQMVIPRVLGTFKKKVDRDEYSSS
jgi:hypothetical protein